MEKEHIAVTKFREYLKINTEQPNPNYYECKDFLYAYAKEVGLDDVWSYECVEGKPFVGFTLEGSQPELPSILLYSHTDVVPTIREHWTHDPYSAFKDEEGNIFARGAQDMKCVGIQYVEAFRILKASGKSNFLRTIHFVWGPDEEIGADDGMRKFALTSAFKCLNVGFALDEGLASEDDVYRLFYGERSVWLVNKYLGLKVICPGAPGHGSRFIEDTAGPKLTSIVASFNEFREKQMKLLANDPRLTLGDVTSVNLTKVSGGVQVNVIPSELCAWFDIRVTPFDEFDKIKNLIRGWCKKAGRDVTYKFEQLNLNKTLTSIDKSDPWWNALSGVFEKENCKIKTEIFTGATDSRFLRELGYKAIGFSPMIKTPTLLHDHNEFLNEKTFLVGVNLYVKIIERLANLDTTN